MKKSNLLIIALAILIVVIWIYTGDMNYSASQKKEYISPVYKEMVIKKNISGRLYPEMEISAKSSVSGTLVEYYVQIGDKVSKGDRIAKVKVITNASQLEEANAQVKNLRILDEKLKKAYERDKVLYNKGLIAACEYEETEATYMENHTRYQAALNQLQIINGDGALSNIVVAPCNGVISSLPLEQGASIMEISNYSEGTTIAQISQNTRFVFKSQVIEEDVIGLHKGMKIPVTVSSSEHTVIAKLHKISTAGKFDEHRVMKYEIQAVFTPPTDITIFSGFSASASIVIKRKKALTVPCEYITFKGDSAFVTIKKNEKNIQQYIKIGDSDGEVYEILKGIERNSQIVKSELSY